jgi:HAD superfamily hydrolase (TIGR01509 family)
MSPPETDGIELVIFDCDGVLIDSEIISARVLMAALRDLQVPVDWHYFKTHFLGRSFPKVAASIRRDFEIELPSDFETGYRATLLAAFEHELKPVEGIEEVLAELGVACCVATSSSPERAARSLAITGLNRFFGGAVFTASEVANGKPAPDLFLHAASSSGVVPEACLVIEDSVPGLHAAQSAGMRVWHFVGGSHLDAKDAEAAELPRRVPFFDTWAAFFAMAPNLKRD